MGHTLKWLVVRLGQDLNWWVDETSEEVHWGGDSLSLLDPNQVAYLRKALKELEEYGFEAETLAAAFHAFDIASELSDGRLRLKPSEYDVTDDDASIFALPDLWNEEEGRYPDLLDQLISLRIKLLNATHHYVRDVTEEDLEEEIQARNADRYFSATAIHVFNELEDILTWKPAEWDEEEGESRVESQESKAENGEDDGEEEKE